MLAATGVSAWDEIFSELKGREEKLFLLVRVTQEPCLVGWRFTEFDNPQESTENRVARGSLIRRT